MVKATQRGSIEKPFLDLKKYFENGDNVKIITLLENELFFEKVDNLFVECLCNTYSKKKDAFIDDLKGYYIEKATKGIKFTWGHSLY